MATSRCRRSSPSTDSHDARHVADDDARVPSVRQRTVTTSQAPIWELPDQDRRVEGLDAYGEPDPAYAAALGLVSAPLGRRAAAAAIDIGIYCLLQLPLIFLALPLFRRLLTGRITWYGFVNHPDFVISLVVAAVTLLLTILFLVAQLFAQGRWGFTAGKLATGLRLVNVSTLGQPGFWRTAWRALVVWLPLVTVLGTLLFLASPLWSRLDRCRGWQDRAGRAWLVDARRGLDPFDKKRMRIARKTITSTPASRVRSLPSLATSAGGDARNAYRPGARTSAGVLGVARPHSAHGRVVVGLTGLEPGESAHLTSERTGVARLGAYLPPGGSEARASDAGMLEGSTADRPGADHAERRHRATGPAQLGAFAPPAPPAPAGASITLLLDSGQRIQVSSPVVLGRSPVAIGGADPLAIADPDFSISKVHVVLRPVAGGLEVVDQGSTNGTAVVHEGQEQPLTAGEVGVARLGDTIRMGERTARVLGP